VVNQVEKADVARGVAQVGEEGIAVSAAGITGEIENR